jgi:hypothetical protein
MLTGFVHAGRTGPRGSITRGIALPVVGISTLEAVTRTFASWDHIIGFLRPIDGLRRAANPCVRRIRAFAAGLFHHDEQVDGSKIPA